MCMCLRLFKENLKVKKGTLKHIPNKTDINLMGKTLMSLYEEFSPFFLQAKSQVYLFER